MCANKGTQVKGGGVNTRVKVLHTFQKIHVKVWLGDIVPYRDWCENKGEWSELGDEKNDETETKRETRWK